MRKLASSFRVAAWLGCGLYLGACGPSNLKPTDLTPREQLVQIFDKGQLPSCTLYEELGVVEVESGSFDSSLAKLRRAAAGSTAPDLARRRDECRARVAADLKNPDLESVMKTRCQDLNNKQIESLAAELKSGAPR